MTRRIAAAVALVGLMAAPASGRTDEPPSPEVAAAIDWAAREWNVSESKLLSVANCESSFNPRNTNGRYDGLFSHHRPSWPYRVKAFHDHVALHNSRHPDQPLEATNGDVWSAINNARISAAMVAGVLPGYRGWGPWAACA